MILRRAGAFAAALACLAAAQPGAAQSAPKPAFETTQKFRYAQTVAPDGESRLYLVGVLAARNAPLPADARVTRITLPRAKPEPIPRDAYNQLELATMLKEADPIMPGKGRALKILYVELDSRNLSVFLVADKAETVALLSDAAKPRAKVDEVPASTLHSFTCGELTRATVNIAMANWAFAQGLGASGASPRWTGAAVFSAADPEKLTAFVDQLQREPSIGAGKAVLSSAGLGLEIPFAIDRANAMRDLEGLCTKGRAAGLTDVDFGLKISLTVSP